MPTLRDYRREMVRRSPDLGRVDAIASGSATTIVVTALAGQIQDDVLNGHYLVRSDAAAAERHRRCSDFTGSTGTLTQPGPNYADTTFTSESVEILAFAPHLYDLAINQALHKSRFLYREIIPLHYGQRYPLEDFPWITQPQHINRVLWRPSGTLSRNRYFDNWNGVSSTGALTPDFWTLSGASATMTQEGTTKRRGRYSLALARAGTDAVLRQSIGLLWSSVSAYSLRGETVTVVGVGRGSLASAFRFRIDDGVTVTNTPYITNANAWEEVSAEVTVGSTATQLNIEAILTSDGTVYIDEFYIVHSGVDDADRLDNWVETEIDPYIHEEAEGLALDLGGSEGIGRQIIIESFRPYLVPTVRLSADDDNCSAPLETIAESALVELDKILRDTLPPGDDALRYAGLYREQAARVAMRNRPIIRIRPPRLAEGSIE